MKKFKSLKGPLYISSTAGHAAWLDDKEFKWIPEHLWGEAYRYGAISDDMILPEQKVATYIEEKKAEQEAEEIADREEMKNILRELYKNPQGNVDKQGNIKYQSAVKALKKVVKKDILDSIWKELAEESE